MNRFRAHAAHAARVARVARVARSAVAMLSVLAGLSGLAGCGTGSGPAAGSQATGFRATGSQAASSQAAAMNPNLDPGTSLGARPAPDIRLVNQFGQPMSLSQFRGKVVVLSFAHSRCTTVFPLTAQ